MKRIWWAGLLAMMAVAPAYADEVKVSNAWARATAPGQDTASVQLTITSKRAATLIGAASGSAQSVEIHSMVMEGEVMKMRQLEELPLPAKTNPERIFCIGYQIHSIRGKIFPGTARVSINKGKIVFLIAL